MIQTPLMLSISGLRGVIGSSLTPLIASRFAAAYGQWLKDQLGGNAPAPHVIIGRDSRPSGEMFAQAAASGLAGVGCKVTRCGILSTPGVGIMVEHLKADAGMVLTASHNPIIWNGIKPLVPHNGRIQAPPSKVADAIIKQFKGNDFKFVAVDQLQPMDESSDGVSVHTQKVLQHVDIDAIRKMDFKVVVDSVHGAGGAETHDLLSQLNVELVHLYKEPTGQFPHTPGPTRENLVDLCSEITRHKAAIGFAQDPDADRLAIIDENGTYIGEEYTLALASLHILDRMAQSGTAKGAKLVTNLSTSRMIDDVAQQFGATVTRTPVGEANVASTMLAQSACIGGEGNGGVILPEVTLVRDSFIGMALILDLLATSGKTLSENVARIPAYHIQKDKIDAQRKVIEKIGPVLSNHFSEQKVDTQDGVRIDWEDRWVHVRPSNTEPIIRFIAEAQDEQATHQMIDEAKKALGV